MKTAHTSAESTLLRAVAADLASPGYFPGKDYPDREEWLKIREERNTEVKREKIIYGGKKPLMLGLNRAKRQLDDNKRADNSKHPAKRGSRGDLIEQRHAYYRRDQ
jgi:hypothetical protein